MCFKIIAKLFPNTIKDRVQMGHRPSLLVQPCGQKIANIRFFLSACLVNAGGDHCFESRLWPLGGTVILFRCMMGGVARGIGALNLRLLESSTPSLVSGCKVATGPSHENWCALAVAPGDWRRFGWGGCHRGSTAGFSSQSIEHGLGPSGLEWLEQLHWAGCELAERSCSVVSGPSKAEVLTALQRYHPRYVGQPAQWAWLPLISLKPVSGPPRRTTRYWVSKRLEQTESQDLGNFDHKA